MKKLGDLVFDDREGALRLLEEMTGGGVEGGPTPVHVRWDAPDCLTTHVFAGRIEQVGPDELVLLSSGSPRFELRLPLSALTGAVTRLVTRPPFGSLSSCVKRTDDNLVTIHSFVGSGWGLLRLAEAHLCLEEAQHSVRAIYGSGVAL